MRNFKQFIIWVHSYIIEPPDNIFITQLSNIDVTGPDDQRRCILFTLIHVGRKQGGLEVRASDF